MSAYAILLAASISAIETEKYDPSPPRAFLIAKLFGKTIEEIFFPQKT